MSSETAKQEVSVKSFIDGDTTHFNVPYSSVIPDGVLKARYVGVNTPESTGKIEEWGKKAASFTKDHLKDATSIILESDGMEWETDSTSERHLVWVWYKSEGSDVYQNLNLQLLQEGLAVGSKAGDSRYGELCTSAIAQARAYRKYVHSKEKDPDFYYGSAIEIDLKELSMNIKDYLNQKVAFEGVVSYYSSQGVYVEKFDDETQMCYGIYAYYGYTLGTQGEQMLAVGNRVRIVGKVGYFEGGDSYQVSDLNYDVFDKNSPDNVKVLDDQKHPAKNVETTIDTFQSNVTFNVENEETGAVEQKTYKYAELALNSSISMKNLYVKSAKTSASGEITLTCTADGKEIKVHTVVLKDEYGRVITEDAFIGKTINVTGIIDCFYKTYQIKVFSMNNIVFAD
jgi:endonuclease YncB( thermonuclease family)